MSPSPPVVVVHALPRRVHLRARALAAQRDACERVAAALARVPGHDRVSVRERTGSVIVESEEATLDPGRIAARLAELVDAARDEEGRPITAARARPGTTRVAEAVVSSFAAINADVAEALEGEADLGALLPVAFAGLGLVEIAATGKLPVPPWFNLFWWSLRSFMTFNHPPRADEESGGHEGDRASNPAAAE